MRLSGRVLGSALSLVGVRWQLPQDPSRPTREFIDRSPATAASGKVISSQSSVFTKKLPAEFVHGSFVPRGAESRVHIAGTYSWMTTEADYAYEELGDDVADGRSSAR